MFGKRLNKKADTNKNSVLEINTIAFKRKNDEIRRSVYGLISIENNSHMTLNIHNKDYLTSTESAQLPPFVKENGIIFVLSLPEFLDCAHDLKVTSFGNYISYQIISYYQNTYISLEFRESDVYPSMSKFITDRALSAIYKNTCKGE